MKCIIHMLSAGPRPYPDAVYVINGFSVCDDGRCIDAIGGTPYETVMNAREIDWNE